MISRFIIKSNEWYENLPKNKRDIFYICLCFIPYILGSSYMCLFTKGYDKYVWMPILWLLVVVAWRMSFTLIKEFRK